MAELARSADGAADAGSRIACLESIRGLAALQVLLLHLLSAFAPALVGSVPVAAPVADLIHLSPLSFLYDGNSAVYIFFALSGYVLTRSFERSRPGPVQIVVQIMGRMVRLGLPALAAVLVAAAIMLMFGSPNEAAGELGGSAWFAYHRNVDISLASAIKDGTINAVLLGYSGTPAPSLLEPWQQPIEQSFVVPLWTLSIEFYGSLIVLALCWSARRSRALWWAAVILGTLFTSRSAYVCFFVGHLLASFACAEAPVPRSRALPGLAVMAGVLICVIAEVWQPDWLKAVGASPTHLLFPGQFAPMQQKVFGAMLLLTGLLQLEDARRLLSTPWLVRMSRLSFPLYLVHWPILFGPVAALFLQLAAIIGVGPARLCAIASGIALSLAASVVLLPVDRLALELSRGLRWRRSAQLKRLPVGPSAATAAE